jgi:hypothetical protein
MRPISWYRSSVVDDGILLIDTSLSNVEVEVEV